MDSRHFLTKELAIAQAHLRSLRQRVEQCRRITAGATRLLGAGMNIRATAKEIEKFGHYSMQASQPLSDWVAVIPEDLARWELTSGPKLREDMIYAPKIQFLSSYIEQLRLLLGDAASDQDNIVNLASSRTGTSNAL